MGETADKIHYHPGFYGATELELRLEKADLSFTIEYTLFKEPTRIDMLVITKEQGAQLDNEVGRIFKQYNILEYKSPNQELSIDDFFKVCGYGCMYKAQGDTVNQISEDQVTVSLFRDTYPRELFKALEESGRTIEQPYPGIYYIKGRLMFDTQIVVMKQLDADKHSAFRVLAKNAREQDVRKFLMESAALTKQGDRMNADAVFQVSIQANLELYARIRRDDSMCKAMEDLMQDVIEKRVQEAAQKAAQEAAQKVRKEAAQEARLESMAAMIRKLKLTEDQAMDVFDIPDSERSLYAVWLSKL